MVRVKEWLPSESVVTVPKIYRFDEECHVIIMEDCGEEILTLKDFLREGKGSSSRLLAQTIGRSLGEFLGSMHNWSRENPAGILAVFEGNQQAKSMSAWATYGRVVATLSQKDILPALSEPPMEVSASDLETITKVASDMKSAMISARDTVSLFQIVSLGRSNAVRSSSSWGTSGPATSWSLLTARIIYAISIS